MNGIESVSMQLIDLSCREFFIHINYNSQKPIEGKGFYFTCPYSFDVDEINAEQDKLTVSVKISMHLMKGTRIAGLTVKSVHYAGKIHDYQLKFNVLGDLINQAMSVAQGCWITKFKNIHIQNSIPQGINKFFENELEFKKSIDTWK